MQNISAQGPKSKYISVLKMSKLIQGILPVQIMARSDLILNSKTISEMDSSNANIISCPILFRTCKTGILK